MDIATEEALLKWQDDVEKERESLRISAIDAIDAAIAGVSGLAIIARTNPRASTYAHDIQVKLLGVRALIEEGI